MALTPTIAVRNNVDLAELFGHAHARPVRGVCCQVDRAVDAVHRGIHQLPKVAGNRMRGYATMVWVVVVFVMELRTSFTRGAQVAARVVFVSVGCVAVGVVALARFEELEQVLIVFVAGVVCIVRDTDTRALALVNIVIMSRRTDVACIARAVAICTLWRFAVAAIIVARASAAALVMALVTCVVIALIALTATGIVQASSAFVRHG